MKRKQITQILEQFKQAGYHKISLSELAWSMHQDKKQLLGYLKSTGFATKLFEGEHYLQLTS